LEKERELTAPPLTLVVGVTLAEGLFRTLKLKLVIQAMLETL
jgi:hypothetical protein